MATDKRKTKTRKTLSLFSEENRITNSEIKRLSVKKAVAMLEVLLKNAGQWKK